MDRTRRGFLQNAVLWGSGLFTARSVAARQQDQQNTQMPPGTQMPGMEMDHSKTHKPLESSNRSAAWGFTFSPVVTPDVADLTFELDNGVKAFISSRNQ